MEPVNRFSFLILIKHNAIENKNAATILFSIHTYIIFPKAIKMPARREPVKSELKVIQFAPPLVLLALLPYLVLPLHP